MDRHMGRLQRQSPRGCALVAVKSYVRHFFRFPLATHLICLVLVHILYISGSSHVCAHILAKMNPTKRHLGRTAKEPFMCIRPGRVSLTLGREICGLCRVQSSPFDCPAILVLVFWSVENESVLYTGVK